MPTAAAPLRIPLYYDFASSLCYVAHRVLERLAPSLAELDVEIDWKPLDLTEITHWRRGAAMSDAARANTERVSAELAVPLCIPEQWPDSRRALAVALAIEDPARRATWRERVFCAAFEEGRDIGADGAVEGWLEDLGIGFPAREIERRATHLELETALARDRQVQGVPTFMLGDWPLAGIQDDRTTLHLLGRYASRTRSPQGS